MTTTLTRRLFGASLAALSAAALPGLAQAAGQASKTSGGKPLYKDPKQPVDARIQDLLSRMTLEEKAAQLIGIWLTKAKIQTPEGEFSPEEASKNFPHGLGQVSRPTDRRGLKPATVVGAAAGAEDGSIGRNAKETAKYVNAAQKWAMEKTRLGIPMLMHDEALHGYVARDATSFPQSIALASTFDPELTEKIFSVAAREMRARGANMALAPVVDVARDPRWGRIEETYGEDPHLCAEIGLAAIRGFQGATLPLAKDKVFVTLKHMTG
ncbi:MAG: glycoside hydrolase family 3 N-terminal domain-containing protein, partial [Caulobacter sp.]